MDRDRQRRQVARMGILDRTRAESRSTTGSKGFAAPKRSEIIDRLQNYARRSEHNRMSLVRVGDRWYRDIDSIESAVNDWDVAFPGIASEDINAMVEHVYATCGIPDRLTIYRTDDALVIDIPHAVMDGLLMMALWSSLVGGDIEGRWASVGLQPPSLAYLVATTFLRRPASLIGVLKDHFSERTAVARSHLADSRARATATVHLDSRNVEELEAWAAEQSRRVTTATVLMCLVGRAITREAVEVDELVHVVMDGRRYGDSSLLQYYGNLSVGVDIPLGRGLNPADLARHLARGRDTARPLAAMSRSVAGSAMVRAGEPAESQAPVLPRLSFSYLVLPQAYEEGTWRGGFEGHRLSILSDLVAPNAIAVVICRYSTTVDITVTYNPDQHPVDMVEAALEQIPEDPIDLMTWDAGDRG